MGRNVSKNEIFIRRVAIEKVNAPSVDGDLIRLLSESPPDAFGDVVSALTPGSQLSAAARGAHAWQDLLLSVAVITGIAAWLIGDWLCILITRLNLKMIRFLTLKPIRNS